MEQDHRAYEMMRFAAEYRRLADSLTDSSTRDQCIEIAEECEKALALHLRVEREAAADDRLSIQTASTPRLTLPPAE